ncbi:MAG: YqgE/AlgH family protein [Deltaproteobacteria bacterium]|nr:YqgE/AlgH family protein [Deltaproteobacteria bacterium]
MPQLTDPNFARTVVLLCEHENDGALGLVVNRPTPFLLGQLYEGQDIEGDGGRDAVINYGGPVQPERGFVLYEGDKEYDGSLSVLGRLHLGTSLDILRDIAGGAGPQRFLFCLGYAGWAADQLETEIARNDWLVVPGDEGILFGVTPEDRWEKAIRLLGIEPALLTQSFGTA